MGYAWKFVRTVALSIAVTLALLAAGVAVARAVYVPKSACTVPLEALGRLALETMTRADVEAALGCGGVLQGRRDYGGRIVVEDYAWRVAAWPFGRAEAQFINGVLHGTTHHLLTLRLDPGDRAH